MSTENDAGSSITCFIIAAPGHLSDLLREQLNQEGVLCLRIDTNPLWQPSVQVTALIERSDFVAAILEGEPSPNPEQTSRARRPRHLGRICPHAPYPFRTQSRRWDGIPLVQLPRLAVWHVGFHSVSFSLFHWSNHLR